jgi:hypothetical protein
MDGDDTRGLTFVSEDFAERGPLERFAARCRLSGACQSREDAVPAKLRVNPCSLALEILWPSFFLLPLPACTRSEPLHRNPGPAQPAARLLCIAPAIPIKRHTPGHFWAGAPTKQGAMQIQAGTWSVTGKGSLERTEGQQTLNAQWTTNVPATSAPIAVLNRASDGKRIIKSWHAQLRGRGGVSGTQQLTIDGKPQTPGTISLEAFEWAFPTIEVPSTQTTISGSNSPKVTGSVGPMQPGGSQARASCAWSFGKSYAPPLPPPTLPQ